MTLATLSPELRQAIVRAYRAWARRAQQLELFDLDGTPA